MKAQLENLKDTLKRVDVELRESFTAAMREAVDVLGLKSLSEESEIPPGLLARYASGRAAPPFQTRRTYLRYVLQVLESRIAKPESQRARSDEDRAYEAKLLTPHSVRERLGMKFDIKDMVGNGKKARLEKYQAGALHYVTETGFRFAVPVAELGEAQARPDEHAMLFMRWLRKAIAEVNAAQEQEGEEIQG